MTLKQTFSSGMRDVPAGLVVFLVALPLCLGIALASDAPLVSGLVAGVVGGVLVTAISRSPLSVSGPAAGLAVLVAAGVQTQGSFEAFLPVVLLMGVLQIVFGFFRLGVIGDLFPNAVIKGMLAAIGITIILKQLPHALGRDSSLEGNFELGIFADKSNAFTELLTAIQTATPGAILISALGVAIILLWDQGVASKRPKLRYMPGALLAVIVGTGIAQNVSLSDAEHYVRIPIVDGFTGLWAALPRPDWSALTRPSTYQVALTLAVVASIETLLSIDAVDRLDPHRRLTPKNRELLAQGAGNIASGLLGGLPITSVIVRSSANVYAGAQDRLAAITHGVLLLAAWLLITPVLNQIPLAALAAVLLVVGYKLSSVKLIREMWGKGPDQFAPFLVTVVAILGTDILLGCLIGVTIGAFIAIKNNYYSAISVIRQDNNVLIRFTKDVSYINRIRLRAELRRLRTGDHVWIDGARATAIDPDVMEILADFQKTATDQGIQVEFKEVFGKDRVRKLRFQPGVEE